MHQAGLSFFAPARRQTVMDDVRKCPECGEDSLIVPIHEGAPWICITDGCDHAEVGEGTGDAAQITE